jgi:tetratricopeptide (TPR) repeat protein
MGESDSIQECLLLLGLSGDATVEEARRAHRDLVAIWHPDRLSGKNPRLRKKAEEKLKEINAAFDRVLPLLSENRPADKAGAAPEPSEAAGPGEVSVSAPAGTFRASWHLKAILSLLAAVTAIGGYLYWKALIEIETDRRVALKRLELSEFDRRALVENLEKRSRSKEARADGVASGRGGIEPGLRPPAEPLPVPETIAPEKMIAAFPAPISENPDKMELDRADARILKARGLMGSGNYREAKRAYESALALLERLDARTDAAAAERKARIRAALSRDEIVFGARGYIRDGNRWFSPEEYRKEFIVYRGQRVFYGNLQPVVSETAGPYIRAWLRTRYPERLIHKKLITPLSLELTENTAQSVLFRALFHWEIWTFRAVDQGRVAVDVGYNPDADTWNVGGLVEP